MATGSDEFPSLPPISGVRLGSAAAGIKATDRDDVLVIEISESSSVAAVFTQNAFCAAPVIVAKRHLAKTVCRYLLVNAGNANAGTGDLGIADALYSCVVLARQAGCQSENVLPFSTGVIGEALPVAKLETGSQQALENLSATGWEAGARAIMTTDTRPKGATATIKHNGKVQRLAGIAKGAGMIRPNMATMLSFIATDAKVSKGLLQELLAEVVEATFNRITIDGDTSTNDAVVLIATGHSGAERIDTPQCSGYPEFRAALHSVCADLAKSIVRDGEGATKFVGVRVNGGESTKECLRVAYAVAESPLVKTALFASDPNWGRILAAVGRAGVKGLRVNEVAIFLNDLCIFAHGALAPDYTEERGQAVMGAEDLQIRIELNRGEASEQIYTSDLSHDYVSINADYRS